MVLGRREACLKMLNSSASQQHWKWEEETQRVETKGTFLWLLSLSY